MRHAARSRAAACLFGAGAAVLLLGLTGCKIEINADGTTTGAGSPAGGSVPGADGSSSSGSSSPGSSFPGSSSPASSSSDGGGSGSSAGPGSSAAPAGKGKPGGDSHSSHSSKAPEASGPKIDYFTVTRRPKCAEGTAVFRADPVPLVIEWRVSGGTGAALSVDAPPDQVGSYGNYPAEGSETFTFSCGGEVGSTETHTYTLHTVGGDGKARSKTLTVSAKVLDDGTPR